MPEKNIDERVSLQFHPAMPVERILGIWRFTRPAGSRSRARSTPGHLLHLVEKGDSRLILNGRKGTTKAGDMVYYYESEEVETIVGAEGIVFYSIAFDAPTLGPLPFDRRIMKATKKQHRLFNNIFTNSSKEKGAGGTCRMFADLLEILCGLPFHYKHEKGEGKASADSGNETRARLWWELERRIRSERIYRASLADLAAISGRSRATVVRACRHATGEAPGARVRSIRLDEAAGLLRLSTLNMGEIASYLGYPRLAEFSREFSTFTGESPTNFRKRIRDEELF